MIGGTLARYIGTRFLVWILGLFFGATLLALMIDIVELLRSASDRAASTGTLLLVSLLRVPLLTERILPFAVLLGAIGALVNLSRRSELVVSRAAGQSVWQFTGPGVAVALCVGVFSVAVYNPLATAMKAVSDRLAADNLGAAASILSEASSEAWLRQRSDEGDAIMHVEGISNGGEVVFGPVLWVFGPDGLLTYRVSARSARLDEGKWRLLEAIRVDRSGVPERLPSLDVPTRLTADQVRGRLSSPDAVSFWALPEAISQASASGTPAYRFLLQFHVLLSRPLLLAAMVLIAATVSLGMSRAGGLGRMILGGVTAGFVLYVVTEIARDLGSEGLVPAALAAWSPAVVATLLGVTILLHREDG